MKTTKIAVLVGFVFAVLCFAMAGCNSLGEQGVEAGRHASNAVGNALTGNLSGAIGEAAAALAVILGAQVAQHKYTVRRVNKMRDEARRSRNEPVECPRKVSADA